MEHYRREKRGFFRSFFSLLMWISVVKKIILATTIISLISLVLFGSVAESIDYLALKPSNILEGKYLWTLILHMFVHGGIFHLIINMFVLLSLGGLCERIIGRKRMFWFYMLSGIFAGLLSVILAGFYGVGFWAKVFGEANTYMVGASGAIFAIAGLFVMLLPRLRFMIIFLPFFSLPAFVMVPLVLVMTWLASIAGGLPIGNVAHFGGFIVGVVYGSYLRLKYPKKVALIQNHFR